MRSTEHPAIVRGNQEDAVAYFIEDAHGDLVDIEYECCGDTPATALPWPAYEFAADYDSCCRTCGAPIHKPAARS